MNKLKYYIEKYKFFIICIIIIIILLIMLLLSLDKEKIIDEPIEKLDYIEEQQEVSYDPVKVKVDIKGFVEKPGVYELDESSRVIDVIKKAGGLKKGANTEYINLSKKLTDEMIIIIYSDDEIEKFKKTDKQTIYIKYECECPDNINSACINEKDTVNTNGQIMNNQEQNGQISINTASLEDLMTLPGIGESKAKAILEYRNKNGKFESIEDIMKVSGIGESVYSKIKDNIKL